MKSNMTKPVHQVRIGAPDERYRQLVALADEGNSEAAADLFREYGIRYGEAGNETPQSETGAI
jgi:hypothetical protein